MPGLREDCVPSRASRVTLLLFIYRNKYKNFYLFIVKKAVFWGCFWVRLEGEQVKRINFIFRGLMDASPTSTPSPLLPRAKRSAYSGGWEFEMTLRMWEMWWYCVAFYVSLTFPQFGIGLRRARSWHCSVACVYKSKMKGYRWQQLTFLRHPTVTEKRPLFIWPMRFAGESKKKTNPDCYHIGRRFVRSSVAFWQLRLCWIFLDNISFSYWLPQQTWKEEKDLGSDIVRQKEWKCK